MLNVILLAVVILIWTVAMIWAYWGNGGMKDFKEDSKKTFDKIRQM